MSRDFTPRQLFNADVALDNSIRNSVLTFKDRADGEEFRVDNHLAKDRYPELSFLFEQFDDVYKDYQNFETALKTLDRIEEYLRDAETDDRSSTPLSTPPEYDTVKDWFDGKLDPDFYYHEHNDQLFRNFLQETIGKDLIVNKEVKPPFQLTDTDESIHIDYGGDMRLFERLYTYKLAEINGTNLVVDMYAAYDCNGNYITHNYDRDNSAYVENENGEKVYFYIPPKIEKALEEAAHDELAKELTPQREGHGTIVILAGASGSGKDTLRNALVENGYERLITSTTRAPREGEKDGVDYHFKTVPEFEAGIEDGSIFEYRKYESSEGVKYYGSQKQELDPNKDYVIVLDDTGVEDYQKAYGRDKVFAVLVEVPDEVRYERAFARAFPNGEPTQAETEKFDNEWAKRLADDKARFSEEFIARAINYRLDNEDSIDNVQAQLQATQQMTYEAVEKDPNKHYAVKETYDKGTGCIRVSLEEAKPYKPEKKWKKIDDFGNR